MMELFFVKTQFLIQKVIEEVLFEGYQSLEEKAFQETFKG